MEIKLLEVLVMNNGEILCEGKTVGFTDKLGKYLSEPVKPEVGKKVAELERELFTRKDTLDVEVTAGEAQKIANDLAVEAIEVFTAGRLTDDLIRERVAELRV